MVWGAPHDMGTGSTGQVDDAHKALDAIGVAGGPLAVRVLAAVGMIAGLKDELQAHEPGAAT